MSPQDPSSHIITTDDKIRFLAKMLDINVSRNGNLCFEYNKWSIVINLQITPWNYSWSPGGVVGIEWTSINITKERLICILLAEIAKKYAILDTCRALPMPIAEELYPHLRFDLSCVDNIMAEI